MSRCKDSLLIFGDSGDGKSAQVAVLAEHVYATTGRKTLVYTGDGGGWETMRPHVELGVIDIVDLTAMPMPWEWMSKIVQGLVPEAPATAMLVNGRMTTTPPAMWRPLSPDIGMVAYEGLTGFGDILMQDLADQAAKGVNIGGQASVSFQQGDVKVGSNNQAHFGVVQGRLASAVAQSQRLPVDYVVWTAMARRGQDQDNLSTILGPQVVGKALTSEVPRWFKYTFRLMVVPGNPMLKTKEEHRLYLRDHMDQTAAGARGMGNDRTPLDATPLPEYIAPADVVKALGMIREAQAEALGKVKARMEALRAQRAK